jgi:thiamine pyrophosphate-dependent acetolactate synthase large subunit-like protein
MKRIDAVQALAELVTEEDLFISSIGGLWDDWWNHRPGGPGTGNTFSPAILGSVSSTALGLAYALPHRRIVALETDGSMLLNTGILCTLGCERPPNLTVVVFDNGIYENIGGPVTHTGRNTDLALMAAGGGCPLTETVRDVDAFGATAARYLDDGELGFLVAKIEPGRHPWESDQRKPTDGIEDKYQFVRHIEQLEATAIQRGATHN